MKCPKCRIDMFACEYAYGHPQRYDGVSEFICGLCETRVGRWTGKILKPGYCEPRYGSGGKPVRIIKNKILN